MYPDHQLIVLVIVLVIDRFSPHDEPEKSAKTTLLCPLRSLVANQMFAPLYAKRHSLIAPSHTAACGSGE